MDQPRIFDDFNNTDKKGSVRLNALGTFEDVRKSKIELAEGAEIILNDDDGLETTG